MNKILIVGGAGYIGGYLTDQLISVGHDVTVLDNLMYETRYLKKVKFINCNILDTGKLSAFINDYDTVIWLAAIVGDGACAVDPSITKSVNEDTVKWLVDNYSGKIIFTSTCSIYGANNDLIDEEAIPNPLSVYASTKLGAERYITENYEDYLIFRLGTLHGTGDEHSRLRFDLVANALTMKAAMGQTLQVFGGEQWRPLLHVKDVATAIMYGINNEITGLFNLSDKNYTMKELASVISDIVPCTVDFTDMKFEDQRNYKVTNTKIFNTGWRPNYHIEDGISDIYKLFKENRIKSPNDPVYSNAAFIQTEHDRITLTPHKIW